MSNELDCITAYAVIRVDAGPLDSDSRPHEYGGTLTAGPTNVRVKEIVMSAEEARNEVVRLNELNSGTDCTYYWQFTHVFLNGGSHGRSDPPCLVPA